MCFDAKLYLEKDRQHKGEKKRTDNTMAKSKGQTTQWPKEGHTTQWPKVKDRQHNGQK
jgi:hypothetical protein